mmetsp:Transcript_4819/g.14721  ORF Transcript_4819/g.14721 Transcript_4819/m.14721 type:complete len:210 (-) Transcript_4819:14-643(-)
MPQLLVFVLTAAVQGRSSPLLLLAELDSAAGDHPTTTTTAAGVGSLALLLLLLLELALGQMSLSALTHRLLLCGRIQVWRTGISLIREQMLSCTRASTGRLVLLTATARLPLYHHCLLQCSTLLLFLLLSRLLLLIESSLGSHHEPKTSRKSIFTCSRWSPVVAQLLCGASGHARSCSSNDVTGFDADAQHILLAFVFRHSSHFVGAAL